MSSSISNEPSLRWLVIGADSLIGAALVSELEHRGRSVVGTSRRQDSRHQTLDLCTDTANWRLPPCDVAIVCAAVSRLADCEADSARSARINVEAPLVLAQKVWSQGGFVVFLSSSAVFEGTEAVPLPDSAPCPTSLYGRQKAAAEALLMNASPSESLAVARPTKVLSSGVPLLRDWRDRLNAGSIVTPHAWRFMSPLYLQWVTRALLTVGDARASGIWHLSGSGDISFADFAVRWAAALGYSPGLVEPQHLVGAQSFQRARLDMTGSSERFGFVPPTAGDTIAALVSEYCA